ncbi:MAG: cobyrinic acid a,c-diamide synthase [Planctomycetota bacterium]|jgi:cobyrinic acid a,c-diamide synthase
MASLYISAAHKSSGKTTVSIGLCAALKRRGINIQAFKKGPDYIDPAWLAMASGNPCYNLDYFIAGEEETILDYRRRSSSADLSIIEGNKGLYDGLDLDGSNSNAALAKAINSPVIMVVDARGTIRGIAPLLIGYQVFDKDVNIAGVIANMTGGARHESKLRAAVEHYTDIPFLGALGKDDDNGIDQTHLGLIPGYEDPDCERRIANISSAIENNIDLSRLIEVANTSAQFSDRIAELPGKKYQGLKIGIARDRAFGFYYSADLEAMERYGAELVFIDLLQDKGLPEIDALFIGGGFPERHAEALQANLAMRHAIRDAIENYLPCYAECGGLMYLSRNIEWQGQDYEMVGVVPGDTHLHSKPRGRGYVKLEENNSIWPGPSFAGDSFHAHEFHYSSLDNLPDSLNYAYNVRRGNGIINKSDGLIYKNLLASYAHLRHTSSTPWVSRFVEFAATIRQNSKTPKVTSNIAH